MSIDDEADQEDFSISPPLLSVTDAMSGAVLSGRLDSDSPYVAEHILQEAEDEDTLSDFYRRYQLGYVTSRRRDPPFSVCGCTNISTTCAVFSILGEADVGGSGSGSGSGSGVAGVTNDQCPSPYYELDLSLSGITCADELSNCYSIDGFAHNTIQTLSCEDVLNETVPNPCDQGVRPVSAIYPDQVDDRLTVTMWYNNQVLFMNAQQTH